jgi:hypothetical protein
MPQAIGYPVFRFMHMSFVSCHPLHPPISHSLERERERERERGTSERERRGVGGREGGFVDEYT